MSYSSVFKNYASYIKGLKVRVCGDNMLIQLLASFGVNLERYDGCSRPELEVWKNDRKYLFFRGSIDADSAWAMLNLLVRISNDLVHLGQNELQYVKDLDSELKLIVDMGCIKCLELIDALGQVAIYNNRVTLEIYDLKSNAELMEKEKIVEAPKVIYKDRKVDGNLPLIAILKTLDKITKGQI
jgi:alkyl hydroperoxide reductase subunit AhpF